MNIKMVLFPQRLSDGVDCLKQKTDDLTTIIERKEARINELETSAAQWRRSCVPWSNDPAALNCGSRKTNGGGSRSQIINSIKKRYRSHSKRLRLFAVIESDVRRVSLLALAPC